MNDNHFYKIPMKFNTLFEGSYGYMETCSEKESIDKFIELLIMTCPGEHKYDRNFGSEIWEMDFVRVVSPAKWKEEFAQYLTKSIVAYEHRITDVKTTVDIVEISRVDSVVKTSAVKKRAMVRVDCTMKSTGEQMIFYYTLYLGPISSD